MSGGAYNYAYLKILDAVGEIQIDLREGNFDKDVVGDVEELVERLIDIGVVLRSLEWYMSGDTTKENFKETFERKFGGEGGR